MQLAERPGADRRIRYAATKEEKMEDADQKTTDTGTRDAGRATSVTESAPVDRDIGSDVGDLDRGSISGAPGGTAGGAPGAGLGGSSAGATGGTVGGSDMGGVTTGLTGVVDYGRMGDADARVSVGGDRERAQDVMGLPNDAETT
jgi:hypothetical protein